MQLRIFTEPQQGASYDDLLAVAKTTEECGFDAFFRSDHFMKMGPASGLPGPTDAWITLAGLARETSRIRLGTLMTPVTFRLPGPLAISVAQVDQMSGGRVELGIGTGWYQQEHDAYGIPFGRSFGQRFEMLEEQLEIITALWTAPDSFSFEGKHYSLKDSPALPKPVQQPRPPILIGGLGPKRTPRLAATYADEYNVPFQRVDNFAAAAGRVREACEKQGRDPDSLVYSAAVVVCCGSDEAEFSKRAEAIGRQPDELRQNGAAGIPSEVVDRIGAYADARATRVYLQILDLADLDHLRLLASDVAPHVT